jgi:hypothetical protein
MCDNNKKRKLDEEQTDTQNKRQRILNNSFSNSSVKMLTNLQKKEKILSNLDPSIVDPGKNKQILNYLKEDRQKIIKWLFQIHAEHDMKPNTFFSAVVYLDHIFFEYQINIREYLSISGVCLLLSGKKKN